MTTDTSHRITGEQKERFRNVLNALATLHRDGYSTMTVCHGDSSGIDVYIVSGETHQYFRDMMDIPSEANVYSDAPAAQSGIKEAGE